jgi:hypothetical protein
MIGVFNRLPGVVCEIATCTFRAAFTEHILVIPGNPDLCKEQPELDVVLCQIHEREYQSTGLAGVVTAHGDTITGMNR